MLGMDCYSGPTLALFTGPSIAQIWMALEPKSLSQVGNALTRVFLSVCLYVCLYVSLSVCPTLAPYTEPSTAQIWMVLEPK